MWTDLLNVALITPTTSLLPFNFTQPLPVVGSISSCPSHVKAKRFFSVFGLDIPIEIAANETELEIAQIIRPDLNVGLHLHIEVFLIPCLHLVNMPGADKLVVSLWFLVFCYGHSLVNPAFQIVGQKVTELLRLFTEPTFMGAA